MSRIKDVSHYGCLNLVAARFSHHDRPVVCKLIQRFVSVVRNAEYQIRHIGIGLGMSMIGIGSPTSIGKNMLG